jgi:hypothetical protein
MSPKYELLTSKKSPQYKANRPPPSPMRSLCSLKDVPLHLAPMGLAKIDGKGTESGEKSGIWRHGIWRHNPRTITRTSLPEFSCLFPIVAEKDSGFSILSTSGDEASKLEIDIQSARLPSGKKIAPYPSWRYTGTCGGAASIQADVRWPQC